MFTNQNEIVKEFKQKNGRFKRKEMFTTEMNIVKESLKNNGMLTQKTKVPLQHI